MAFLPAEPPDLHIIHQRIKGNMEVLQDFVVKREEGRTRQEYLALLRRDMAAYYSYSDFLLTKLMDIFPLPEVGSCPALLTDEDLDASPVLCFYLYSLSLLLSS